MKKTILITVGVLTILIVIGVWVYLFMYGTPKNSSEVFARFSGGAGETVTPAPAASEPDGQREETVVALPPKKLRQLTTKPVAGAVFTQASIRYVEQGTGHIYDINLTSGAETLVNGTTIPQASEATFSKEGVFAAITTFTASGNKTIVEQVVATASTTSGVSLPPNATNIQFGSATSTLMYLLKDTSGSAGYSYNVTTHIGTPVFTTVLRDVRVLWSNPLYIYTTPAKIQEGYLYKVVGRNLEYVTNGGTALVGITYDNGVITSAINSDGGITSTALENTGVTYKIPLELIPEKCIQNPGTESTLYCAVPVATNGAFPDQWYMGAVSFTDVLWRVDIHKGEALALSNFLQDSSREIDVAQIGTNSDGTLIWFINKNDNTLWMFDTTIQ